MTTFTVIDDAELAALKARLHELEQRLAERAEAEAATLRMALLRVQDQLAHDAPEWEHDHEDAEPWDECRACTYDAMLRDVQRAALAGRAPDAPRFVPHAALRVGFDANGSETP